MQLPTSILLTLLSLSLVSANAHASPPHRRHLARSPIAGRYAAKVERAGGPISNETQEAISSAEAALSSESPSAGITSAVVTSSSAGESGAAGDIITPSSTSSVQSTTAPVESAVESEAPPVASETQEQPVVPSSASPSPIAPVAESSVAAAAPSNVDNAPETIAVSSARAALTSTVVRSRQSVVTELRTASSTASASAAAANGDSVKKVGSLSMTAFIAIVVVASVVGLGAFVVFGIRKWKLRPSNRFDKRMKPIDFSPHNNGMNDDFLEKTLQRSGSRSSADMQRQQFVKDLETDPNYVPGVPNHDFTAGSNHAGYGTYTDHAEHDPATYHHDPFAHAQAYEYDPGYYGNDAHGYPPAAGQQHVDYSSHDYPTQDQPTEGYADLQRGNSNGSDRAPRQQVYHTEFPSPDDYLGRPTGGADGPYAQAAQYRGY